MQLDEILSDLEEHKELSANRLMELEKLTSDHQEALKEIEKLKMDVSNCLFFDSHVMHNLFGMFKK